MRVLFVAMAHSVHTARWIAQFRGLGWDLHLFPVEDVPAHPGLVGVRVHEPEAASRPPIAVRGLARRFGFDVVGRPACDRRHALAELIGRIRPDVVHSMEMLKAGALVRAALEATVRTGPWLASNWGSETHLLGRLPANRQELERIFASCDALGADCRRDQQHAREMGFRGDLLPVLPVAGGMDLARVAALKQGPPSQRRVVLLKGYQDGTGRALVGVRAIELCADALRGYCIAIHSPHPEVGLAAELVRQDTGLDVVALPPLPHEEMLAWHGRARVAVGLSINDGLSLSFVEALVMGALPIQSDTGCAREWLGDEPGVLFVTPNDSDVVAGALRRALEDDGMADAAAARNAGVAARFDAAVIRAQAIAMYKDAVDRWHSSRAS